MPGFDKSRFFGLRESDDELVCGICLAIICQPVVTPCCSQMFCDDCLRQWLQSKNICPNDRKLLNAENLLEPQRSIKNMLNKLEIMCDFYDKGCDKRIALGRLESHIETCRYNPEAICDVCNEKNGEIRTHDCNYNLLEKTKMLVKSNEELTEKHNEYVNSIKRITKELKDSRACIEEIKGHKTELNKENKTLKFNMFVMDKRIKTFIEFSAKSIKHFDDSIKQSSVIKDEFIVLQKILTQDTRNKYDLDSPSVSEEHNKSLLKSSFQYKLENVSSLRNIGFDYSPAIMFYGFKWRIMTGHSTYNSREYLKFLIECNSCNVSTDWCFEASVQLKIINQTNCCSEQRILRHKFCTEEHNWGYPRFMTLSKLLDQENGFVKDNAIILEAVITP